MNLRVHFPIFKKHPKLVYLDSASTTQCLDVALKAEEDFHLNANANVHRGLYPMAEMATEKYESVRDVARRFLHAGKDGDIIFTHGCTESLNMVVHCWGQQFLKKGDEVVLTVLEHHSNIVPWQLLAQELGIVLKFCPILPTGNLDYKTFNTLITRKTKMVSVTGLSNVLGTLIDLSVVVHLAKKVGAKICVDAAQLVAHLPVNVKKLDVDFLAFSSHKIYGPMGAGVLYAKRSILEEMAPWLGGGGMIRDVSLKSSTWNDVPWKFEAGTPAVASVIGMGAAMEFMMNLGGNELMKHDRELQEYTFKKLNELPFVDTYGPKGFDQHRGTISFNVKGVHPHDVASILSETGVCVRAGHHCAIPLMKAMGLGATVRVSFGLYNTKKDVEALVEGLKRVAKTFA